MIRGTLTRWKPSSVVLETIGAANMASIRVSARYSNRFAKPSPSASLEGSQRVQSAPADTNAAIAANRELIVPAGFYS